MSRPKVISVLNRLLSIQRSSFVSDINEAAWTHPGNKALAKVTRIIVDNHEHYCQRLTVSIEDRHGGVDSTLQTRFTSLKDLDLDSLLAKLIENASTSISNVRGQDESYSSCCCDMAWIYGCDRSNTTNGATPSTKQSPSTTSLRVYGGTKHHPANANWRCLLGACSRIGN